MTPADLIVAIRTAQIVEITPEYALIKIALRPGAVTTPAQPEVDDFALAPPEPADPKASEKAILEWFENEFWPILWRKVGKGAARAAALRKAKTPAIRAAIIAAVRRQTPAMLEREEQYRPHPVTWLNQERWLDEATEPEPVAVGGPSYRKWSPPTAEEPAHG